MYLADAAKQRLQESGRSHRCFGAADLRAEERREHTETGIDSRFFPDALLLDALSILWPAIWIPYFYFSKRVKRVFKISEGDMAAV